MEDWKEYKLGDIGTIVGGATPSTKDSSNYDGNIAWITPKDLSNLNCRYISHGERMISQKGFDDCSCRMLPKNSILFSSRAPIGYVAIAQNALCTNQGFKSIIPNNEIVDSLFLYYLLVYYKPVIENMGSGTTFKEVSGSVMKALTVNIPNIDEQKRIAAILSSLDDKIELNRRINGNLEQQAQALFNHYFIERPDLLGKYKIGNLTGIANYLNGLAMQKFRPQIEEKGIPVLKIKELGQGYTDASSDICSENIANEYKVHDGDVIFSWSGTLMVKIWCGGLCGLNQHLFKVTSGIYPKWFYYFWTKHHLNKFVRIAQDKAVTMGHIKRGDLETSKILIPPMDILTKLNTIISPLFNQIIKKKCENKNLAMIRDTLLPRLMSGELKIDNLNR